MTKLDRIEKLLERISEQLDDLQCAIRTADKQVLNIDEVMEYAGGLSRGYIHRLTSTKQIPHYKKNNRLYFLKSEIDEWLQENPVASDAQIEKRAEQYELSRQFNKRKKNRK